MLINFIVDFTLAVVLVLYQNNITRSNKSPTCGKKLSLTWVKLRSWLLMLKYWTAHSDLSNSLCPLLNGEWIKGSLLLINSIQPSMMYYMDENELLRVGLPKVSSSRRAPVLYTFVHELKKILKRLNMLPTMKHIYCTRGLQLYTFLEF
jgi:hypothetical protein